MRARYGLLPVDFEAVEAGGHSQWLVADLDRPHDTGGHDVTYTVRVEGDMLHVTWPDGFGGWESFTGTFRRVGR